MSFNADGTLDASYAATGEVTTSPARTLRDGQGVWEATAEGYILSVVALLVDKDDRYAGLLTMRETGEIDAAGETSRGRVTFEVTGRDTGANTTGSGTSQGARVPFDDLLVQSGSPLVEA